jgi:hypothetical protein
MNQRSGARSSATTQPAAQRVEAEIADEDAQEAGERGPAGGSSPRHEKTTAVAQARSSDARVKRGETRTPVMRQRQRAPVRRAGSRRPRTVPGGEPHLDFVRPTHTRQLLRSRRPRGACTPRAPKRQGRGCDGMPVSSRPSACRSSCRQVSCATSAPPGRRATTRSRIRSRAAQLLDVPPPQAEEVAARPGSRTISVNGR